MTTHKQDSYYGARASEPPIDARAVFTAARNHLAKGIVLGQNIVGRGAVERSAAGAIVTLSDGREVLDFSSYGVNLFGHGHPVVTDAIRSCLDRMPTSTRSLCNPTTVEAASRLVDLFRGSGLDRVWFGLNGSDAVEAALKLARLATGRSTIAAVEGGFHGKTLGALGATWSNRYRDGLDAVLPSVVHLPMEVGALDRAATRNDIAALIFEPIQGEGGVRTVPVELLEAWRTEARHHGIFFIADEIQAGFGRCGAPSLAVSAGLQPDGVLLGKPLGGGVMPISAMLASPELWSPLQHDPLRHTSTFSGHPLGCAAAIAAIGLLPEACQRATDVEARLRPLLDLVATAYPSIIAEVRGKGLLWGLVTRSSSAAGNLLTFVQQNGLLVSPCLGDPHVLRMLPPSIVSEAQVDQAIEILDAACAETERTLAEPRQRRDA